MKTTTEECEGEIHCGDCARALLCIARPESESLPLAACHNCRRVVEVVVEDPQETPGLPGYWSGETTYTITDRQLLIPAEGVCPRRWIFDFAPRVVRDSILCPRCATPYTKFFHNRNNGGWRWGHNYG